MKDLRGKEGILGLPYSVGISTNAAQNQICKRETRRKSSASITATERTECQTKVPKSEGCD